MTCRCPICHGTKVEYFGETHDPCDACDPDGNIEVCETCLEPVGPCRCRKADRKYVQSLHPGNRFRLMAGMSLLTDDRICVTELWERARAMEKQRMHFALTQVESAISPNMPEAKKRRYYAETRHYNTVTVPEMKQFIGDNWGDPEFAAACKSEEFIRIMESYL